MRIGVSITMDTLFRGVQQEFSNIFYYNLPTAITAPSESIIDEIVTDMKLLHATNVNFKRGQVWSAGGTAAQNQMLFQKFLTGAGSQTAQSYMDKERALLIRWPAGFDTRGLPVYLRKWFHVCGNARGVALGGSGILANQDPIADADRATLATFCRAFNEVGNTEFWQICSKTGRERTDHPQCHKYLEHHQLGDAWR